MFQFLLLPATVSADFINARAYGTDTFAGHASALSTSMLNPNQSVVFVVERPDASVVRIPAEANAAGIATADFLSTQLVGAYKVAIYLAGTNQASPQNNFTVYANALSASQSTLTATKKMVTADGSDSSFLTVTLYDDYRNPISNHYVTLISSNPDVTVKAVNDGISDAFGRVNFSVSSSYSGVSTFTAMDTTANVLLSDRMEVIFSEKVQPAIGGNFQLNSGLLSANLLNDNVLPGPLDSFEIEDLPTSVTVNTDQTLTVVAKDGNGNVAKNYTGTIVISSTDDNAILPNNGEYTFQPEDQGQFTFNLAARFSQMGSQTLQVFDKDDWDKEGQFDFEVVSGQAVNVPVNDSLSIKSPSDGAVLGSGSVVLSGNGDPNINLKVFVDGIEVDNSQTDTDGFFMYTVNNLSAGQHTFYVMSDFQQVSESVTVTIDTLPPVLNTIQITPNGVISPGQLLNLVVNSEPGLDVVRVRMQGVEKELLPTQGQSGAYSGSVAAPALAGSYPVDVTLIDDLGNQSQLLAQTQILVQDNVIRFPAKVQNLEAISGDTEVNLMWDPITGHTTQVVSYNVYYGTNFNQLDQVFQTKGADTSLRFTKLQNNVQYFFGVKAVDAKGVESEQMSALIAVTPSSDEPEVVQSQEDDVMAELEPFMDPEVVVEDFFEAQAPSEDPVVLYESATETVTPPIQNTKHPLMGVVHSQMVTLTWESFAGVQANAYKVNFGLNSGQYNDYMIVPGTQNTAMVQDLINDMPYYFAVEALDANGKPISPLSDEFMGTPSSSVALHGGAPAQASVIDSEPPLSTEQLAERGETDPTGAPVLWVMVLSFLFATGGYLYKKSLIST